MGDTDLGCWRWRIFNSILPFAPVGWRETAELVCAQPHSAWRTWPISWSRRLAPPFWRRSVKKRSNRARRCLTRMFFGAISPNVISFQMGTCRHWTGRAIGASFVAWYWPNFNIKTHQSVASNLVPHFPIRAPLSKGHTVWLTRHWRSHYSQCVQPIKYNALGAVGLVDSC